MNIDQRLEALTQSLELVAAMQGESEKRVARLEEAMIRAEQSRTLFDEGMTRISLILAKNENRLDDLEGRR